MATGGTSSGDKVVVRRLGPDDWCTWRDVRLTALADAPYAFGSALATEQAFDETTWRSRVAPDNGMTAIAIAADKPVGAIGTYTPPMAGSPMLVAAWVDAGARGRGVGDALVAEVLAWAREHDNQRIELRVADGNTFAKALFLRHGFLPTGHREPLESDPTVSTELLTREI
jgi:RimJ/RimL family protein N-acetyltransferase